MIDTLCSCGGKLQAPESQANQALTCPSCGKVVRFVAAESLADGAGAADFDMRLLVESGPQHVGEQFFMGGVVDIAIGKLPDKQIVLEGTQVSRFHCKLVRLDFGPSRWKIVDNHSTNGLLVNHHSVDEAELRDGDLIRIGEYQLIFQAAVATATVVQPKAAAPGGPTCPSCQQALAPGAKICVACGINIKTGRPLLTSHDIDEDELNEKAHQTIRVVSWIIPFGLYPIASEAFGTRKPYVIWALSIITVLTSVLFFIAMKSSDEAMPSSASLMLWTGHASDKDTIRQEVARLKQKEHVSEAELRELLGNVLPHQDFHWYQLFTHAFLHGSIMHLAGNLLFLIVFGTRINALIGNALTLVLYPLLGMAAAGAHFIAMTHHSPSPMLGASGAIMGLAGMYLILFPVHKMYMTIWLRLGLLTGFKLAWKVWAMRGFWVVLFFIMFDVLFTALGVQDGVAHWAHLGGFIAGMFAALVLLSARLINARGADILSVMLGKRAWVLVGKPSDRSDSIALVSRATVVPNYPG